LDSTPLELIPPQAPLRCCLLSGGSSRRMGRDKALLDHPAGGSWLSHTLGLLAELEAPISLCSNHPSHRQLAEQLRWSSRLGQGLPLAASLQLIEEPIPPQGPLQALGHLMHCHPGERLLLCPVDMPWLDRPSLDQLQRSAEERPRQLCVACDGARLHPLLGIYPASEALRRDLHSWLAQGHRSMHSWLARHTIHPVLLPASALHNCNRPEDWPGPGPAGLVSPAPRATG
jgi:molybdopterin-guanine dinucleotide biosynthesis protein A